MAKVPNLEGDIFIRRFDSLNLYVYDLYVDDKRHKTNKNGTPIPKIADEDITAFNTGVYRALYQIFFPYYSLMFCNNREKYEVQKTYSSKKFSVTKDSGKFKMEGDLILFEKQDEAINDLKKWEIVCQDAFYLFRGGIVGKFCIPKGSKYYLCNKGRIVPTELVWTGKLKYFSSRSEQREWVEEYPNKYYKDIPILYEEY